MRGKMRNRILTCCAVAVLGFSSWAWAQREFYNTSVSATQANTAVTFTDNGSGGSSAAFRARTVVIRSLSSSANTCYFDLKDTVATTSDVAIEPGGTWGAAYDDLSNPGGRGGWAGVGVICNTAETATILVTASR